MRLRRSFWLFFASVSGFLIAFSLGVIDAHAALSDGRFLTPEETLAAYGQTITGRYYDGSGYTDINFTYNQVSSIGSVFVDSSYASDIVATGNQGLLYYATASGVNVNPQYITFDLHPEFSLLNTSQIHACIALSGGGGVSNSVYSPPRWEWNINGLQTVFQASGGAGSGYPQYWPSFYLSGSVSNALSFVHADYTSNSPISGYSIRASFYGNIQSSSNGNTYTLFVGCPYVSSNASGQSGTLPAVTTSPSGDVNVNVDVDLTETNSILDSILNGISGLVNGIKGLFVPEQSDVIDFKEDLADILDDTFSGYSEAEEYIDDVRQILVDPAPSSIIKFPAIDVPCTNLHIDAQQVDVNYNNEHMEFVRVFVDIIFTIWLINMIMNKHHAIMVGEKSVEVEGVDVDDY